MSALALSQLLSVPAKVRELPAPRGREGVVGDAELVGRALGGDRFAEELLYRRHVKVVVRVVARLLARSAETEDTVQDTFISAFRDLPKLRDRASFRSWILQIAVNLSRRRFRRRRLLRSLGLDREQDDLTLESQVDPNVDVELVAEVARLDRLLAEAPTDDRFAWVLRYVEHYRLEEIASLSGCSLATVKRRIARVQDRVIQHLTLDLEAGP